MAEFVRWATDAYMDFLDTRGRYSEGAAQWGLLKLRSVRNRLLVNTSEVDRSVQLNHSDDDVNFRHDRMLEILSHLFNAIIDHHKKVSNSRIGVEEVLLLAEESDFVNRRTNNYTTLHKKFAIDEGHGLPMDYRLNGITMAIGKQVKQRGHQMPIEYAIRVIAPVMPRLDHDILVLLPLQKLSRWFEEVSLQPIGEKLATEINGRLHPQVILATPYNTAGPSVYNTARSHQPNRAGFAANADMEESGSPSNEEQDLGSHHTSLFGSKHEFPLNTPVPPLGNLIARPFKLALPPTPLDQKRPRQEESGQVLKKARSLPGNTATRNYTVSERARSGDSDFARRFQGPLMISKTPLDLPVSRATPSVTNDDSDYTSVSTPAARHGTGLSTFYFPADMNLKSQERAYDMAGASEKASETFERLQSSRPVSQTSKKKKVLSPMARIEEEQAERSSVHNGSEVDDQGDSKMEDGVDEDDDDGGVESEEESEEP